MTAQRKPEPKASASTDPRSSTSVVQRPWLHNTITLVEPPDAQPIETTVTRWAQALSTPKAVMILVPLLVLVLGVTLTIIGQLALSATSKTMAKERFVEQTATSTLRVESALSQADPLLVELEALARGFQNHRFDRTLLAGQMRDLLVARRGISQVYIALEDGSAWGVGPGAEGALEFQETVNGVSAAYAISAGTLVEKSVRKSAFDPRTRAWYLAAKERRTTIWSKPYVFFFNHHPGVTRARPLFLDHKKEQLFGVVGVDFDVQALTAFMAAGESGKEGARTVVFSPGGVVLAYPFGAEKLAALPQTNEVITHQALRDRQLSALIEGVLALPAKQRTAELFRFRSGRTKMLASVRPLGDGGPEWYVASFSDESSILHELHTHRARSLWIGSFALGLAVIMGWWLAKYILRVKTQAADARAAAERAREQVRDLGSYQLISLIGEGGMGEVWRARHRLLARESAIKLIKLSAGGTGQREEQRERFRREAQAIAGLRSHNTVALFDYGVTPSGTLFYVMELLDGIDLSRLVARHRAQLPDRVRQIMIQVCGSLSEAHDAQLIHRDIKPANLFLCREADEVDVIKVLDFGLVFRATTLEGASQETSLVTNPEHQLGTPAFMSPEQALGAHIDHRSDLYSLGCVAWWLLTGQPPFKADSQQGYMRGHIEGTLPDLVALVPAISPEFAALVLACLEREPARRPISARDLAEALRNIPAGGPAWTRRDARRWWTQHRPRETATRPPLQSAPLRDAEIVGPTLPQ